MPDTTTMPSSNFLSDLKQVFARWRGKPEGLDSAEPIALANGHDAEKPVVKLDPATGLMVERYYVRGKLHREDDKPAVIEYDPGANRIVREQWFRNGKLHRDDNRPAFVEYSASTGKIVLEVFFEDGRLHRGDNSPSAIDYDRETGEPIEYDLRRPGSPPLNRNR